MIGWKTYLNCFLPLLLIAQGLKKLARERRKLRGRRCSTQYVVSVSPLRPTRPLVLRLVDRQKLPIVNTMAERLRMTNAQRQVVIDLAPAPVEQQTFLSGLGDKSGTFAVQLPDYDPTRMLLVYPNVMKWVERKTDRPTDDLMTYEEVLAIERAEDDQYTITCRSLNLIARDAEYWRTSMVNREEAERAAEMLRAVETMGCPHVQKTVDLAEILGEGEIRVATLNDKIDKMLAGGCEAELSNGIINEFGDEIALERSAEFDEEFDELTRDAIYQVAVRA